MKVRKPKGSHVQERTGTHAAAAVQPPRKPRGIDRKYILFFTFLSIAAVMIIVLALLLMGAADKNRYNDYMEQALESYEQAKYDNSLRYLRKAIDIERSDEALLMMADCYEKQENYDKALEMLRMLDTREPEIAARVAELEKIREILAQKPKVIVAGGEYEPNTSSLTLDGKGIGSETLTEVVQLYALTSLSLENNTIEDISALKALPGLTSLNLSGNKIKDISPLSELTGLRVLFLDYNELSDFTPLYKLTNLTNLSIKGAGITESQLTELSNALPNCAIHSDTPIEDVLDISVGGVTFKSDVTELNLSGLGIRDIGALSSCKELVTLDLSNNEIVDLYALMNMPKLEKLNISGNQVIDLRPLMGLATLKVVDASDNLVQSTVPLGSMASLSHLDLSGNPLTDFTGFEKLRALKSLKVKNVGLTDEGLESMGYLSSLVELNIEDNPAISGEAVDAMMARIEGCVLTNSPLVYHVEIGGQRVRTDITELDLSATGISDISALAKLGNLEVLRLSNNDISNLYIFEQTNSRMTLKELYLNGNVIEDISALGYMPNLEVLDISNNMIGSVLPLVNLTNLRELYLSGNNVPADQIERLRNTLIYCEIYVEP